MFNSFIQQYNRSYETHKEREHRFHCFSSNLKKIDRLNRQDPTATYGINKFTDLCTEEFSAWYQNKAILEQSKKNVDAPSPCPYMHVKPEHHLFPKGVDWRKSNPKVLGPIWDQGECGDDWAFGSADCMSSTWALAGHPFVSLSVEEIVQCSDEGDMGCNGGFPADAMEWVIKNGGINSWKNYPYTNLTARGDTGKCNKTKASHHVAHFSKCGTIPKGNETALASYMLHHGVASIAVDAEDWQQYKGGIMRAHCTSRQLDAGISLVGFGEENGVKYWIARNSWTTEWGEKGYARFEYGVNCFGVANLANYIMV
eukprot:TRINITY_DN67459_c3_g5_i6.p1 TRINITY_DN67459_c3_g5~~TRINITY_DN67459_c3_g5_i6.p1  ORF type:complete len:357 (+),score=32.91 TRINITY_DN67459_c3_g5_i6:133-1071(+)